MLLSHQARMTHGDPSPRLGQLHEAATSLWLRLCARESRSYLVTADSLCPPCPPHLSPLVSEDRTEATMNVPFGFSYRIWKLTIASGHFS